MLFLKTKEKENELLHLGPWNVLGACKYAPGRRNRGGRTQGGRRRRFPATRLAGGEGYGVEELEGVGSYLGVVSIESGTAGGGLAAEGGGDGSSAPRWRRSGDREPR